MSDDAISGVKWNAEGLAAAICQDAGTGQVLTLAWMNEEALRLTLEKKTVHFWSRSRQELWHKGATSGNYLHLVSANLDCDGDALLLQVRPEGPACHTGRMSCFFNEVEGDGDAPRDLSFDPNLLEAIYKLILERKAGGAAAESYVARLFEKGQARILEKVTEEAEEVARAAKGEGPDRLIEETADLWFHTLVALAQRD
ncbi:MAG: bifunctional phosphoribosyl-AMP cyclohydrolase/phosphoribosyl-ATP diphosphatase HisIE, partial [bacterium]|nr:bifunctional phosphoribosyl-AMP cyclohydrolase/phosphoribosyl-ATP diphosphatase HisIE [bacterium]